ncbi:MAG TPA: thiamine-phosphate kinase [Burkholderiales bacterium]|nr:thiamine-phosphate kinase [Burkholderiales bacterium]
MASEFELIRRYFEKPPREIRPVDRRTRRVVLGIGDDAALLRPSAGMELAVSTDLLLEGRHFRAGTDPRKLGHKSLAVNLSDMAAMGAAPRWATLAIALPAADEAWLDQFAQGFFTLARRFGVELIGGDTTRGPLSICITVLGEVPTNLALLRAGARPGDDIWVSGELGGAALGLAQPGNAAAVRRLEEPEPRVELGESLRGIASAAIDVSDGFAQDLGHILEKSGAGAMVRYAELPKFPADDPELQKRCVLSGGDDYELVFTAPQSQRGEIESLSSALTLLLSRVGSMQTGEPKLHVFDDQGKAMTFGRGFDHFQP